jgi:hypothetical protein
MFPAHAIQYAMINVSIKKLGVNPLQRFPSRWMRHALEDHTQNKTMAALSTVKGVARLTGGGAARIHCLCARLSIPRIYQITKQERGEKGPHNTSSCPHGVANGTLRRSNWKEPQQASCDADGLTQAHKRNCKRLRSPSIESGCTARRAVVMSK